MSISEGTSLGRAVTAEVNAIVGVVDGTLSLTDSILIKVGEDVGDKVSFTDNENTSEGLLVAVGAYVRIT